MFFFLFRDHIVALDRVYLGNTERALLQYARRSGPCRSEMTDARGSRLDALVDSYGELRTLTVARICMIDPLQERKSIDCIHLMFSNLLSALKLQASGDFNEHHRPMVRCNCLALQGGLWRKARCSATLASSPIEFQDILLDKDPVQEEHEERCQN